MEQDTFSQHQQLFNSMDWRNWMSMLNLSQAAKLLGVHRNTLKEYIKLGYIAAYKYRKVYRIPEQSLREFLESRRVGARSPNQPPTLGGKSKDHDK